jgi:hypothetical protein
MAIWGKIKVYILAITGTLSALFGVYLYGRNRGSSDTKVKIERADHAKSKQIDRKSTRLNSSHIA